MLHAPLVIQTAKLDISRILTSSPAPSPPSTTTAPASSHLPLSRSISVPAPISTLPAPDSPAPSTTSQYSTATAPPNTFHAPGAPQQYPPQQPIQPAISAPHPLASHGQGSTATGRRPSPSPAKKQSKWSAEEDALITELRGGGMKWEEISRHLPGRSPISCRLHFQNYIERRGDWDQEEVTRLARLYERYKPEIWKQIAKELGRPWRTVESMHWHVGQEELARRAGVPVFKMSMGGVSPIPNVPTVSGPPGASAHALPPGQPAGGVTSYPSLSDPHARANMEPLVRAQMEGGWPSEESETAEQGLHWPSSPRRAGQALPSLAELTRGVPAFTPVMPSEMQMGTTALRRGRDENQRSRGCEEAEMDIKEEEEEEGEEEEGQRQESKRRKH